MIAKCRKGICLLSKTASDASWICQKLTTDGCRQRLAASYANELPSKIKQTKVGKSLGKFERFREANPYDRNHELCWNYRVFSFERSN